MLSELVIRNFALVEDEVFAFSEGLNILTGETGAGKSLIVDAMGFLLGSSARERPLRSGAESGFVAARLADVPYEVRARAEELGFEAGEEGEFILNRDFKQTGRTACRVNGKPASLAAMRELGSMLVDLHGQHQQYSLLRPNDHLKVLDRYIVSRRPGFAGLMAEYASVYREIRDKEKTLHELREGERSRLREIDWTRHELEEIEALSPQPGEDEDLAQRIKILSSAAELHNGAMAMHERLSGDGGVRDALASQCGALEGLLGKDERLQPVSKNLQEALALIDESIYELSGYADQVNVDDELLEELLSRREQLRSIMRKYGPGIEDVLRYAEEAGERLRRLEDSAQRSSHLEAELQTLWKKREELLDRLGAARREEALSLAGEVEAELAKVGMNHCRFSVEFAESAGKDREADGSLKEGGSSGGSAAESAAFGFVSKYRAITASGGDEVQFLIAPNPGEAPKPLIMIASGGEISRIMLALLSLFSEFQKTATFFFDEIDAGLGGTAAQAVASRLKNLASRSQVICITHLAILAAAGDSHLHLYKAIEDGRTKTHAVLLQAEDREKEIARMLSGDAAMGQALEHARYLLRRSVD
ncbi:DNA repair protein RecN [bacterium]|nr:DNA repair protein RecN [bacterium]